MDGSRLRKKVILDLLAYPWTLIPAAGGMSLLLLAGAFSQYGEYLALAGAAGVLAGLGGLATRWILNSDGIIKNAHQELLAEDAKREEAKLDDLARRLKKDRDPRNERMLQDLRGLMENFRKGTAWTDQLAKNSALEITSNVDTLFRGCIKSLERTLELWDTAQTMQTRERRQSVLDARERLLQEIESSIQQLAKTIDEVHSLAVKQSDEQNLAQIRQELNQSMEVARRVEERMKSFEDELGGAARRLERE